MPHHEDDGFTPPPVAASLRTAVEAAGARASIEARDTVKAALRPAIEAAAHVLGDRRLSVVQLSAKMLIEQLFAIDRAAALAWLDAVAGEETAETPAIAAAAQEARAAAFERLVQAIAERGNDAIGPLELRLFL